MVFGERNTKLRETACDAFAGPASQHGLSCASHKRSLVALCDSRPGADTSKNGYTRRIAHGIGSAPAAPPLSAISWCPNPLVWVISASQLD
jgi:hypothetical protein